MKSLPRGMAYCRPTRECPQRGDCARCVGVPRSTSTVVDASLCLKAGACPMFISTRGGVEIRKAMR